MIKLVLVRHGQSMWNLENKFTGWTDVDLSEQGIKEAKEAGKVLKDKGFTFDVAYTSVLKRANDTLNYILEELGFKIEEFGINTFKVNAHPTWVKKGVEEETIRIVFDTLIEDEKDFDPVRFNDRVAATVACKASIKGNMRITLDEAGFILNELTLCDNPYNCPHGRPTIIKFTKYELEKMFKRVM